MNWNTAHALSWVGDCSAFAALASDAEQNARSAEVAVLLVGLVTMGFVAMFVGVAMIRALRHVRNEAVRSKAPPTETASVWEMHRSPGDAKDDDGEGDSSPS